MPVKIYSSTNINVKNRPLVRRVNFYFPPTPIKPKNRLLMHTNQAFGRIERIRSLRSATVGLIPRLNAKRGQRAGRLISLLYSHKAKTPGLWCAGTHFFLSLTIVNVKNRTFVPHCPHNFPICAKSPPRPDQLSVSAFGEALSVEDCPALSPKSPRS
jgi:hypothetical protein